MPDDAVALDLPVAEYDLPDGFHVPDTSGPFDAEARCRAVPPGATVKGMFLEAMVEDIRRRGFEPPTQERFYAFHDYPMVQCLELLIEGSRLSYADLPVPEGIRRMSRPAYATFADSLIGKVVFAAMRGSVAGIFRLASRAWGRATNVGKLETEIVDENTARISTSDFYLTEFAALGIAEGVLEACGHQGIVAYRPRSAIAGDYWIRWG